MKDAETQGTTMSGVKYFGLTGTFNIGYDLMGPATQLRNCWFHTAVFLETLWYFDLVAEILCYNDSTVKIYARAHSTTSGSQQSPYASATSGFQFQP